MKVCPAFGAPLIKRILDNFVPDEFCLDPIPDVVLEALNSEVHQLNLQFFLAPCVLIMRIINTHLLVLPWEISRAESGPKISTTLLYGILALLLRTRVSLANEPKFLLLLYVGS